MIPFFAGTGVVEQQHLDGCPEFIVKKEGFEVANTLVEARKPFQGDLELLDAEDEATSCFKGRVRGDAAGAARHQRIYLLLLGHVA